MNFNKKSFYIVAVVLLTITANCKKDKEEASNNQSSSGSVPSFNLTGSPAQNLITVFEGGIAALESNATNPSAAANELNSILSAVNVEDLRAQAKAAKEAGNGATEEEKKKLNEAFEKYKKLAATIGSQDPGAFNDVHTKWSAAFGVK
jgi:hypothetical protein